MTFIDDLTQKINSLTTQLQKLNFGQGILQPSDRPSSKIPFTLRVPTFAEKKEVARLTTERAKLLKQLPKPKAFNPENFLMQIQNEISRGKEQLDLSFQQQNIQLEESQQAFEFFKQRERESDTIRKRQEAETQRDTQKEINPILPIALIGGLFLLG